MHMGTIKTNQTKIAKILGKTQPTISKYFSGSLEISLKDAIKLEDELNIPIRYWINESPKLCKAKGTEAL